MAKSDSAVEAGGPVRPSASAAVAHRPLGAGGVRLAGGLLGDWQRRNRAVSLPLALRQMETAGNLGNLRLAVAGGGGDYRGPVFMDSDLYKSLEAVSWEMANEPSPGAGRVRRRGHRAAGQGPAARRLPQLLRPGQRAPPVRAPGLEPRAVLRRPPDPGRGRGQPDLRRRGAAARRDRLRRPPRGCLPRRNGWARRSPDRRDGARRAVPGDRHRRLPPAGPAVREPARPRQGR